MAENAAEISSEAQIIAQLNEELQERTADETAFQSIELVMKDGTPTLQVTITKEQAERTTLTRGTYLTEAYMVNGVPVFQGCPSLQVKSLKRAQSEVQDLVILEPSVYEPPVPKVYRTKHTGDNASPDLEIAVRKKDGSHEAHGRDSQP